MNLILFEADEIGQPLLRSDPRAQHLLTVLRRETGDEFDAGVINVGLGKGRLRECAPAHLHFDYVPGPPLAIRPALHVLVGLARPQTARHILRDSTTLGATSLTFVTTARTDPNYAASTLWHSGEWRRHVVAGAAQAFDPRLPVVRWGVPLVEAVTSPGLDGTRIALDLYEAAVALTERPSARDQPVIIAIGPERGWGAQDRQTLRQHGFTLVRLNLPVLRVETAVVAALTLLSARRESV